MRRSSSEYFASPAAERFHSRCRRGLVPLHDKEPDEIIAHERLTEVRVTVKDVIPDAIIGLIHTVVLGNIGILAQTIVIEGNRAPEDSPEPARRLDR